MMSVFYFEVHPCTFFRTLLVEKQLATSRSFTDCLDIVSFLSKCLNYSSSNASGGSWWSSRRSSADLLPEDSTGLYDGLHDWWRDWCAARRIFGVSNGSERKGDVNSDWQNSGAVRRFIRNIYVSGARTSVLGQSHIQANHVARFCGYSPSFLLLP